MRSFQFVAVIVMLFCVTQMQAQTLKEFFNSSSVSLTYLGIDFTHAKLLNEIAPDVEAIQEKQYPAINGVIVNEPKKYDFAKYFNRDVVDQDLSFVKAKNATIKPANIAEDSSDEVHFKDNTVDNIVKGYDFKGKKGIGLLFITESMNKTSAQANVHLVLLDMGTGKILLKERFTGKAAGFGFRNYWTRPYYEVLEQVKKSRYKEWQKSA